MGADDGVSSGPGTNLTICHGSAPIVKFVWFWAPKSDAVFRKRARRTGGCVSSELPMTTESSRVGEEFWALKPLSGVGGRGEEGEGGEKSKECEG